MGAVIGLTFGIGILLIWQARSAKVERPRPTPSTTNDRLEQLLAQAGYAAIRPHQFVAICGAVALLALIATLAVTRSSTIAMAFASFAAYLPIALVKARRRQRTIELREVWPDVVDNLASAVRAGLSLPEAVAQLAVRGPAPLREPFRQFGDDYRATGRFGECLDRLKAHLADPVADRIVESLRLAREVGGSDLGRLLRTLSQFLREDARTRAEIEARQSWTVNAARLALTAPWLVLGLLALRPETVAAYDTVMGAAVLLIGGGVSLLAYRIMLRIARLPEESRVLR
jgi:tight adherence protein B